MSMSVTTKGNILIKGGDRILTKSEAQQIIFECIKDINNIYHMLGGCFITRDFITDKYIESELLVSEYFCGETLKLYNRNFIDNTLKKSSREYILEFIDSNDQSYKQILLAPIIETVEELTSHEDWTEVLSAVLFIAYKVFKMHTEYKIMRKEK